MQTISRTSLSFLSLILIIAAVPFFEGGRAIHALLFAMVCALPLVYFLLSADEYINFKNKYVVALSVFLGFATLSAIFSPYFYVSFFELMWWWIYFAVFVGALTLLNEERAHKLSFVVLLVAVTLGVIGVSLFWSDTSGYIRLRSLFYQHNAFGGFMLLPAFLSLGYFLNERVRGRKIALGVLTAFLVSVLLLTFSRGSMLSYVLAGVIITALSSISAFKKGKLKLFIKVIIIPLTIVHLGAALCAYGIFTINTAFKEKEGMQGDFSAVYVGADSDENAVVLRLNYWSDALQVIKDKPLLGAGLDNYADANRNIRDDIASFSIDPHNVYLKLLAEVGVGTLALFVFFAILTVAILKSPFGGRQGVFSVSLAAGLLAVLIHNGMEIDWMYPANALIFFIFAAVFIRHNDLANLFVNNSLTTLPQGHKMLMFITALLVVPAYFVYSSQNHFEEAEFYMSKAETEAVLAELQSAEQLNYFNNPEIPALFARIYLDKAAAEEDVLANAALAQKYIQQAIMWRPEYSFYYGSAARAFELQDDKAKVEEHLKQSIVLNPSRAFEDRAVLAERMIESGRHDEAKDMIEPYVEKLEAYMSTNAFAGDPDKIAIISALGSMYYSLALISEYEGNAEEGREYREKSDEQVKEVMRLIFGQ